MKKVIIILILFFHINVYSYDDPFLAGNNGIGARSRAMGSSVVGLADDLSSIFWNPAGVSETTELTGLAGYSFYKNGFYLLHLIVVNPVSETSGFGGSYIRVGTDDIPGYDNTGNPTENFSLNQNIISLTYSFALLGFPVIKTIQIGLNVKYFIYNLHENASKGLGFDIGILKRFDFISIGIMFQDIRSIIRWDTASNRNEKLPMKTHAGVSFGFYQVKGVGYKGIISASIRNISDEWKPGFGAEFKPLRFLAFQAGINGLNFNPDKIDYSWGFTFRHKFATLHYAGIINKYEFQNEINISRAFSTEKKLSASERKTLSRQHYSNAREFIEKKNYLKAEEELKKAIELDPKNFIARVLYQKVQKLVNILHKKNSGEELKNKEK